MNLYDSIQAEYFVKIAYFSSSDSNLTYPISTSEKSFDEKMQTALEMLLL